MVPTLSLWLPVLLSAVIVFAASAIIHMVLRYHRNDFVRLPGEANVMEAMRKEEVKPGDYFFPHLDSPKEMSSPEAIQKFEQGPVGVLTVMQSGPPAMGKSLIQWFVYCLAIGVLVAYLTGRTVGPGAEYLRVFRVASVVAFIAYAGAHPFQSIWNKRRWSTTLRHVADGLVYGLLTGGAFAGFWPEG